MDEINEVLTRGVEKVLPDKKGLAELIGKRKIKIYQGFDPSAPSLHLGNFVGLMKLRQFQKLGHEIIFLVGDFSGMIGDPSDKLATRKKLTREQVLENAKSWKKQASMLLNFEGVNPAKIVFNSEWLDKLNFKDVIEICSHITVQQLIERDMFQERIKLNAPIYLHEFLYPIVTGYDSVFLEVDLEIGGNDQMFNILIGRTLEKSIKNKEKYALTMKLLVDKEGKKVGKTTGNALFLDSSPSNFYAGIMSFPDEAMALTYELLTELPLEGIEEKINKDPMGSKKNLAFEIVKMLWGQKDAIDAQDSFETTFQQRKPSFDIKVDAGDTLAATIAPFTNLGSISEAKRLIKQNAVEVNSQKVNNPSQIINSGDQLKVGSHTFLVAK